MSVPKGVLRGFWEIHFDDPAEFLVEVDAIERTPGLMIWAKEPPALRASGIFRLTCAGLEGEAKFQAEVVLVQDQVIALQIHQHDKAKREVRSMRSAIQMLNPTAVGRYKELLEEADLIASATSEMRLSELTGPDPWGDKTDVSHEDPGAGLSDAAAPKTEATAPKDPVEDPALSAQPERPKEPAPRRVGAGALTPPTRVEDLLDRASLGSPACPVGVLLAARALGRDVHVTIGGYECQLTPPGLLVVFRSPAQDGVLDVLVRTKALTKTERDDLLKRADGDDHRATKLLVNKGSMAPARLAAAFRELVLSHAEALATATGTYAVDEVVDPSAFLAVSLDRVLKDVLIHSARAIASTTMREFFERHRTTKFELIPDPDRVGKLKLKPEHQRFIDGLTDPRVFEDLVLEARMARDSLQQFLVALSALGIIKMR
ncbi:MAG: hypothetical protein HYV07_29785 [Deltaproteobacteria bacterium]|nr:hypothetical protein [Deltaproteobacteria bacterium]